MKVQTFIVVYYNIYGTYYLLYYYRIQLMGIKTTATAQPFLLRNGVINNQILTRPSTMTQWVLGSKVHCSFFH